MNDAPTLVTRRLSLRPLPLADGAQCAALLASPRSGALGGRHDQFGTWSVFCQGVAQSPLETLSLAKLVSYFAPGRHASAAVSTRLAETRTDRSRNNAGDVVMIHDLRGLA
jgi:hypothetical protein